MKKSVILIILFASSILLYGQMEVSSGVCAYSGFRFGDSRDFGFNLGMTVSFIYIDFSSNLAQGKGYREESPAYTPILNAYEPTGMHIDIFNAGYNYELSERWFIIPFVGLAYTKDIYQDIAGPDTYYYDNGSPDFRFNFGLNARFFITDNLGVMAGVGRFDLLKAGLVFRFLSSSTLIR